MEWLREIVSNEISKRKFFCANGPVVKNDSKRVFIKFDTKKFTNQMLVIHAIGLNVIIRLIEKEMLINIRLNALERRDSPVFGPDVNIRPQIKAI
jgi:hypothetical protein